MPHLLSKIGLVIAATCHGLFNDASAATLDNVSLNPTPFLVDNVTVDSLSDLFFASTPPLTFRTTTRAPLLNGEIDTTRTSGVDLIVNEGLIEILGRSLDIALDTDFDIITILYGLEINLFTLDEFAVAVVDIPFDLDPDTLLDPSDLVRVEADLSLFFATKKPPITPVPLPASALLLFAGLLALVGCQRLAKQK